MYGNESANNYLDKQQQAKFSFFLHALISCSGYDHLAFDRNLILYLIYYYLARFELRDTLLFYLPHMYWSVQLYKPSVNLCDDRTGLVSMD